ncbi:MAG: hypothetical protein NTY90_02140 [Candidatus Micrarchaeota archaeon]|nr:hypothetical protein [Candidatus Micrarchaeota archaeon]
MFELKKSTPWEKGLKTYRKNVGELRPETIKKIQDLFHRFQLEEKHWYSPETAEFFSAKNVYHLLYALKIPPLKVSHMNQFTYWPVFKEIPADERMQAIARKKAPEVRKVFEKWREWKKKQAGEKA